MQIKRKHLHQGTTKETNCDVISAQLQPQEKKEMSRSSGISKSIGELHLLLMHTGHTQKGTYTASPLEEQKSEDDSNQNESFLCTKKDAIRLAKS